MMEPLNNSRILQVAEGAVRISRIAATIVTAALTIALPLSVIRSERALALVNQHFAEPASTYPTVAVAGLIALAIAVMILGWKLLGELHQIILAAQRGSAITTETADRLASMAWLMAGIQLLKYPAASVGLIVETAFKGPTSEVAVSGEVSGLLIIAALVLFSHIIRRHVSQWGTGAPIGQPTPRHAGGTL